MTLHPLIVFGFGAALFFVGLLIMVSVWATRQPPPELYRISIVQPGDYEVKVFRDGSKKPLVILNRVR